ncbi:unnamed protein product, partial [Owenia fusiformis]
MPFFKRKRNSSPNWAIPKLCLPANQAGPNGHKPRSVSVDSTAPSDENNGSGSSSLEIPDTPTRGRSSSFDTSELTLQVPNINPRSKSLDSSSNEKQLPYPNITASGSSDENLSDRETVNNNNFLKLPRYQRKRTSLEIPKLCVHCVHIEALAQEAEESSSSPALSPTVQRRIDYAIKGSTKNGWYLSDDSDTSSDSSEDSSSLECSDGNEGSSCSPKLSPSPASASGSLNNLVVPSAERHRSSSMDSHFPLLSSAEDRRSSAGD